jgi:predicted nucleotidyltransferase
MVKKKIKQIIKKYLSEVEKSGLNISKVFLYGSHVYGTPNDKSDIDLLIVSPQFDGENKDEFVAKLWLATESVDFIIEPIGVGEKFFNSNQFSPLLDLIKLKGLEIAA